MIIDVSYIEAVWFTLNVATLLYALTALGDARANQKAVKLLNGHSRELIASSNVRSCWFRVLFMLILLAITAPQLFRPGGTELTIGLFALMLLPIILFLEAFLENRDRKALVILTAADVLSERNESLARLEVQNRQLLENLEANTRISQKASDAADAAYKEANDVNNKIASQGDSLSADRVRVERTIDDTHEKVIEIHEVTAPRPVSEEAG